MDIAPGTPIPLNLQLWDGNPSAFVKAFLYNQDGSVYSTASVDLEDAANGLYLNTSILMPSSGIIFASLFVYEDASYTIIDNNYTAASEVYTVAQAGGGGSSNQTSSPIIGYITDQAPLIGFIESNQATGSVSNTQLTGEVSGTQTVGTIEDNQVTGKIEC